MSCTCNSEKIYNGGIPLVPLSLCFLDGAACEIDCRTLHNTIHGACVVKDGMYGCKCFN